jgi:HD-like signal output (HDOD) protein
MQATDQHPTMAELRRLSSLSHIDRKVLHQLADRLLLQRAQPDTVLLERGSDDDHTLYLIQGRVRLTAEDGKVKEFSHEDLTARDPIARLRPAHYEVCAISPVIFLRIDNQLLAEMEAQQADAYTMLEFEVSEEPELELIPVDNRLLIKIYQDLNADRLSLPSLPQVSLRIGQAIKDMSLDEDKLAKLISADPAITAKILKTANDKHFTGKAPINTLPKAIDRLGMQSTLNLVLSFSVKDLFKTGSDTLQRHMRELWRHSRRVAAISHVLATRVEGNFDPCFALLAGLLHDIGGIALLSYARQCPDLTQVEKELDDTIDKLKPQLGSAIIRGWHLPEELAIIAHEAEHWDRDHSSHADYTDLVIIAQLHSFVGTAQMYHHPRINEVPAYRKLNLGELTPDFSLRLLEEASEEIRAIEALLGN